MKAAKKLNIVDNQTGDKNFIKTVRFIQEYSVDRQIRPPEDNWEQKNLWIAKLKK